MSFVEILRQPLRVFRDHTVIVLVTLGLALSAMFYPSDMEGRYATSKGGQGDWLVETTEDYGRHLNTLIPLGAALVLRDVTGLKQIVVITVAGIVASHGPKRLLNNVEVLGTRLGQRPYAPDSKHNSPSGHSTLAGAGAYVAMRRYSPWFALIVLPILLLTMYARVMLDLHTVSAVIAGALTGLLVASLFATKREG